MTNYSKSSFFSNPDDDAYDFYCTQQSQMWIAAEIPYIKDKSDYQNKLTPPMRTLIEKILGILGPIDGLINESVSKQMESSKTQMELAFETFQMAIEVVHNQTYGLFIEMFATTPKDRQRILNMADNILPIKRKADFIKKYIKADIPECLRQFAQACEEGIFLVGIFAVIFVFRRLNLLEAFVFANEQISKDETLHRDYFCMKANRNDISNYVKEAHEILEEAVSISINFIEYLLEEPIFTDNTGELIGFTVPNLTEYIKLLADQVLVYCDLEIKYNTTPKLSWMPDLGLVHKNNFYERKVGNYKKGALQTSTNWKKLIGMDEKDKIQNGVENFEDVDF